VTRQPAVRLTRRGTLVGLIVLLGALPIPPAFPPRDLAPAVDISPIGGVLSGIPANSTGRQATFTATNVASVSRTATFTCAATTPITCTNISVTSYTFDPGEAITVTVTYSTGSAGTGTLSLTSLTNGIWYRTGDYTITVSQSASLLLPPQVATANLNPGATVERGACLTIALGPAAASECGDLRITHALSATRTMNKVRAPLLLYNSTFAWPVPIIRADVTIPPGAMVPNTVQAKLWNCPTPGGGGCGVIATASWAGNEWAAGATRRIALYWDALNQPSGIYNQSLEVISIYSGSSLSTSSQVTTAVVNRANSPFGAGWWLAGLEQLDLASMVWTGGDGSVRQYTQVPGMSSKWSAPGLDHPDTLEYFLNIHDLSQSYYERRLPGGVRVQFDVNGRHIRTVNRQGHTTTFTYDASSRLDKIYLPTPSTTQRIYQFGYGGNPAKLISVTAPSIGIHPRVTTITDSAGFVTAIQDPDLVSTRFNVYTGQPQLIYRRTDRRGNAVSYAYTSVGGRKIESSTTDMGPGQSAIVLAITPEQVLGLQGGPSYDTALVYTTINGPRTDSADITKVWLDRLGQPVKVQDAHGYVSRFVRGDPRWPVLVTETLAPNGWRVGATYDAHGNLANTTDYGFPGNPTTSFAWDLKWDALTGITYPEGNVVAMAYDGVYGDRLWQREGTHDSTRVAFGYNVAHQVVAVTIPGTPAESLAYDPVLGNLSKTRSPKGYDALYTYDEVGQLTQVKSRIDTLVNAPPGPGVGLYQEQNTYPDLLGRDTLEVAVGPEMVPSIPGQTLFVKTFYNRNGQVDSLKRWSSPDPASVSIIRTAWRYDTAGRVVAEVAPDGYVDSTRYDAAGNAVELVTRRGHHIVQTYDALNRLTTRLVPPITYPARGTQLTVGPQPNYMAYQVPQDLQVFTYDSLDRLVGADNGDAKIKRSYLLNGWLESEDQWVRTATGTDFTQHQYHVGYIYDKNGRLRNLLIPPQLATNGTTDRIVFEYEPVRGAAFAITDLQSNVYMLSYTARGELRSIDYPAGAGYQQVFGYDLDGRMTGDTLRNLGGGTFPRLKPSIRNGTFKYDARSLLIKSQDPVGFNDQLAVNNSGLGQVALSSYEEQGRPFDPLGWYSNFTHWGSAETWQYDAMGNRYAGVAYESQDSTGSYSASQWTYSTRFQPGTGRQLMHQRGTSADSTGFVYDSSGNTVFSTGIYREGATFYSADNKLRAVEQRIVVGATPPQVTRWNTEFYRYDALGRRVFSWVRRRCLDGGSMSFVTAVECKTSLIRRTVWNGTEELAEIQMPGDTAAALEIALYENDTAQVQLPDLPLNVGQGYGDRNQFFGRVIYTPGIAIDRPLSVTRIKYGYQRDTWGAPIGTFRTMPPLTLIPFWNRNGDARVGVFSTGEVALCNPTTTNPANCRDMVSFFWPFIWGSYNRTQNTIWTNWFGSLLEGKRDKSGLEYKRNRYYDPGTGRFTQEDPIGLAGGVNLYAYAGSNPVAFSDPFGLCPPTDTDVNTCGNDALGQAWRALDATEGGQTIINIYVAHNPTVQGGAGQGNSTLRLDQHTTVTVDTTHGVGGIAIGLAHEVEHVMGGGTPNNTVERGIEEAAAQSRALDIWKNLKTGKYPITLPRGVQSYGDRFNLRRKHSRSFFLQYCELEAGSAAPLCRAVRP
jgi:RHS repeat-associated protein